MRKLVRKLTLSRDTLHRLENLALRRAGGASAPCNTQSECACSYTNCSVVCFQDPTCTG